MCVPAASAISTRLDSRTHAPLYVQHLVFIAKRLFDAAVADIPPDVALQLQRQEYVAPAPSTMG